MKHDIGKLEERITALDHKKRQLDSLHAALTPIIHRPGWTTLAELSLVHLALDAMEQHVDSIASIHNQLVIAAQQVDPGSDGTKGGAPGTGGRP